MAEISIVPNPNIQDDQNIGAPNTPWSNVHTNKVHTTLIKLPRLLNSNLPSDTVDSVYLRTSGLYVGDQRLMMSSDVDPIATKLDALFSNNPDAGLHGTYSHIDADYDTYNSLVNHIKDLESGVGSVFTNNVAALNSNLNTLTNSYNAYVAVDAFRQQINFTNLSVVPNFIDNTLYVKNNILHFNDNPVSEHPLNNLSDVNVTDNNFTVNRNSIIQYDDATSKYIRSPAFEVDFVITGATLTSAAFKPKKDGLYDIGAPNAKVRDLYLTNNSLYLGDTKVSTTTAGVFNITHNNVTNAVATESFVNNSSISSVPGSIKHVDPSRSDSYTADGSIHKPYKSLATALTALETGLVGGTNYTLLLAAGEYDCGITSTTTWTGNLAIVGVSREQVILKGSTANGIDTNCLELRNKTGNYQFENLTITDSLYGLYMRDFGADSSLVYKNIHFTKCGSKGVIADHDSSNNQTQQAAVWSGSNTSDGGATRIQNCPDVIIVSCFVDYCLRGLRIQDCARGLVQNNYTYRTLESGIYLASGTYDGAGGSNNFQVMDNVIEEANNNGILVIGGINNVIKGNVIKNSSNSSVMMFSALNVTIDGNRFIGCNQKTFNGIGLAGDAWGQISANSAENVATTGGLFVFRSSNNISTECGQGRMSSVYHVTINGAYILGATPVSSTNYPTQYSPLLQFSMDNDKTDGSLIYISPSDTNVTQEILHSGALDIQSNTLNVFRNDGTDNPFVRFQGQDGYTDFINGSKIAFSRNSFNYITCTGANSTFVIETGGGGNQRLVIDSSGNATIKQNLQVDGNLTVSGSTTTVNTTNTTVADKLFSLAEGTTGTPSGDVGLILNRGSSDNAFIGWDESNSKFAVGTGTFDGSTTGDLSYTTAGLIANLTGNVTGNADTATALANAVNIAGQSFDGSSNITIELSNLSNVSSATPSDGEVLKWNSSGNTWEPAVDGGGGGGGSTTSITQGDTKVEVADTGTDGTITFTTDNTARWEITNGGHILPKQHENFDIGSADKKVRHLFLSDNSLKMGDSNTVLSVDNSDNLTWDSKTVILAGDNVASATKLETARTIGGVAFDGTTNIDLPGVTTSGTQDTSGNAGTATALAASRTINGVAFDGSTNISFDSDSVSEGSSNLYHTAERVQDVVGAQLVTNGSHTNITASYDDANDGAVDLAISDATIRGKISVTDSGGDGSLAYNNSTGVLTYTGPSASEVRAHITAGTGVAISSGQVSIGQAVETNSTVEFSDLTLSGNLTVNGTTSTVNTTNTVVTDTLIELGNGTTGSPANDSGIVIERGDQDNAFIGFDESADKFILGTGSFTGASTGDLTVSTGTLVANIEGAVTGNSTTATSLQTARTIAGVSFDGSANIGIALNNLSDITLGTPASGQVLQYNGSIWEAADAGTATNAANVTITANNSTDETTYLTFVDGATGNQGLESDTGLTYNPSTGVLTTTSVTGNLTGNVTGNVSGTAASVTVAAQPNITSVGTLTALTVDNLGIDGNTITANTGALNLTPASGSAIVLDGTINIDAGVITGATSVTSTSFVGALTGNADTATTAGAITGVTATAAELNLVDGSSAGTIVNSKAVIYGSSGEVNATTLQIAGTSVTSTAAELNILDGNTSATSTTIVDADRIILNDDGTMKQVAVSDLKTYTGGGGASNLNGLSDVTISSPGPNHTLIYDSVNGWENAQLDYTQISGTPSVPTSLTSLTNVTAGSPTDGQVLTYVSANSRWEAKAASGGSGGGFTYSAITATTTAQASYHYSVNTSGGAVTLNLPALSGVTAGSEIRVKLKTAGNTLTLDGNSTETIDGSETYTLTVQNQSITLVSDGSSNWEII